jgi:D-glycero-alpha-D-manno-heptose-7-phosphate kinase
MILSRTPMRISFAGGGTDLAAFYLREPGCVVSAAIDKYVYIAVNRKFDGKVRASYSVTEIVEEAAQLRHELIRHALELTGLTRAIEVVSISDVPSEGSGLGASSAYTVGLLNALYAYKGLCADAERLAREACQIEIERCGKPIGKQDQYIAAYGGLRTIRFHPDGSVSTEPLLCTPETFHRLEAGLLLLHTGLRRSSDDILRQQTERTATNDATRELLREMGRLAEQMRLAILRGDLTAFGEILDEGWQRKRRLVADISNDRIDDWYARARRAGALGGKLAGAGGGGFLLLFAPPEKHPAVLGALPELRPVNFRLEPHGSRIVHSDRPGASCFPS